MLCFSYKRIRAAKQRNDMNNSLAPDYFDPNDPNLNPDNASCLEGTLNSRVLWPEGAEELIQLTGDVPTVEDLSDPYYFDKLREKVNRLGLKPNDGHDLEDTLRDL